MVKIGAPIAPYSGPLREYSRIEAVGEEVIHQNQFLASPLTLGRIGDVTHKNGCTARKQNVTENVLKQGRNLLCP